MSFDLEKLSVEELLNLNKKIIHRLNYLRSLKTRSQLDKFEVGDKVCFQNEGRSVEGIVIRVNQKTVSVKTKESRWNIHPSFLRKVEVSIDGILDELKKR